MRNPSEKRIDEPVLVGTRRVRRALLWRRIHLGKHGLFLCFLSFGVRIFFSWESGAFGPPDSRCACPKFTVFHPSAALQTSPLIFLPSPFVNNNKNFLVNFSPRKNFPPKICILNLAPFWFRAKKKQKPATNLITTAPLGVGGEVGGQ